jgi:transposase
MSTNQHVPDIERRTPIRMPSEESSGDRQRVGHISKQGNALSRFLLVEAAPGGSGERARIP